MTDEPTEDTNIEQPDDLPAEEQEFPEVDPVVQAFEDQVAEGKIIKCKPWGKGQGDFVYLDADQFDPKVHEKYEHKPKKGHK